MNLAPLPIQKFFDNNGRPLAGGLLFTYVSSTSTKIATYTNSGGTLNTNPIVLDFRGECRLWIDPTLSYTFVLSPANDTDPPTAPIWTVNDITAGPAQQDNAANDTGNVNNIELSIPQISSPVAFTRIVFKAANTNTGSVTISINGGTANALTLQNIDALSGEEVQAGGIYQAVFDGARWQLQDLLGFPVTAAEDDYGAIIVDALKPPGHVFRYGAVGDGTTDDTVACRTAIALSKGYLNSTRNAIQRDIAAAYFPGAAYLCTSQITVPDSCCVKCDYDAVFFFDDGGSGDYLFKNGVTGQQGGYFYWNRLYIVLKTVTGKGFWLMNGAYCVFDDIYIEGLVSGVLNNRTNVAFRLDATTGIDSFLNEFRRFNSNHCHTGFYSPAGTGFTGKQFFGTVMCYGDRASGDTTARGFDIEGCQDSTLESGYFESYSNGAGAAAFRLASTAAVRWRVNNIVFDDQNSTMNAIVLAGPGSPLLNQFLGCVFGAFCVVVDGTNANDGNFIEANPNISATWTATLLPQTSGTITLTAGLGGNLCYYTRNGNQVRVWGTLAVASVAAPVGRLLLSGLPFTIANSNGNYSPVTLHCDGLAAGVGSPLQAYGNRNSTDIEIDKIVAGVATGPAADIQGGTTIMFSMDYICAP